MLCRTAHGCDHWLQPGAFPLRNKQVTPYAALGQAPALNRTPCSGYFQVKASFSQGWKVTCCSAPFCPVAKRCTSKTSLLVQMSQISDVRLEHERQSQVQAQSAVPTPRTPHPQQHRWRAPAVAHVFRSATHTGISASPFLTPNAFSSSAPIPLPLDWGVLQLLQHHRQLFFLSHLCSHKAQKLPSPKQPGGAPVLNGVDE